MPLIGFGTWGGGDDPSKVSEAVACALAQGYRSIDCAECYKNEKEIGDALAVSMKAGDLSREELFITSKVWNTNHDPAHVRAACERSLKSLQLDYLDLYLIHWPLAWEHTNAELEPLCPVDGVGQIRHASVALHRTWAAMEALVDDGLVRAIGVSNYDICVLNDLLSYARIKPAVNQVELHPYLQQKGLLMFCEKNNIKLTAYSPLGRPGQHKGGPVLLDDERVVKLAQQKDVSPGQLVLGWGIARGCAVIPKSCTPSRIAQNLDAYKISLSDDEMEILNGLDLDHHFCNYPWTRGGSSLYNAHTPNC